MFENEVAKNYLMELEDLVLSGLLFCAVGVRIKMASLLRLRSGRREWRGRRRDDLTQLTYEEHRTLSKVLHESLKTFKATLDYAEMDEESSMSDSDLSDESADTALSKLRQSQNEKIRILFLEAEVSGPVAADENKKSNAAVSSSSTNTEDGRNSVSRYTYSLRRRNQVVEQSSDTKSSNRNSDENVGQNHRISARSSVKKTKSRGEYASTSKTEATATEMKTDATGMDGQTSSSQSKSFNYKFIWTCQN
ncbi:hypothetical protein T09_978 [Trichinella sp. T9]|nr:hypothetical protein T09_978 [Trichinella sp. T9]